MNTPELNTEKTEEIGTGESVQKKDNSEKFLEQQAAIGRLQKAGIDKALNGNYHLKNTK